MDVLDCIWQYTPHSEIHQSGPHCHCSENDTIQGRASLPWNDFLSAAVSFVLPLQVLGADGLLYQTLEDLFSVGQELNPSIQQFEASCFTGLAALLSSHHWIQLSHIFHVCTQPLWPVPQSILR